MSRCIVMTIDVNVLIDVRIHTQNKTRVEDIDDVYYQIY